MAAFRCCSEDTMAKPEREWTQYLVCGGDYQTWLLPSWCQPQSGQGLKELELGMPRKGRT